MTVSKGLTRSEVDHRSHVRSAVCAVLALWYREMADGALSLGRGGRAKVFLLGRYRDDEQFMPVRWRKEFGDLLELSFSTIHSSKGAEADYVILPGMVKRGFPNLRKEDSALALAMPGSDPFPFSEERRLFYVALTRARRSVAMITVQGHISPFLRELIDDDFVTVTDIKGVPVEDRPCPLCGRGELVPRNGRYGPFLGCTNFSCKFTRNT